MIQRHIEPISVHWTSAPISTPNSFALKLCRSVMCIKDECKGLLGMREEPQTHLAQEQEIRRDN